MEPAACHSHGPHTNPTTATRQGCRNGIVYHSRGDGQRLRRSPSRCMVCHATRPQRRLLSLGTSSAQSAAATVRHPQHPTPHHTLVRSDNTSYLVGGGDGSSSMLTHCRRKHRCRCGQREPESGPSRARRSQLALHDRCRPHRSHPIGERGPYRPHSRVTHVRKHVLRQQPRTSTRRAARDHGRGCPRAKQISF